MGTGTGGLQRRYPYFRCQALLRADALGHADDQLDTEPHSHDVRQRVASRHSEPSDLPEPFGDNLKNWRAYSLGVGHRERDAAGHRVAGGDWRRLGVGQHLCDDNDHAVCDDDFLCVNPPQRQPDAICERLCDRLARVESESTRNRIGERVWVPDTL